jgi:hypothetical protein
VRRRTGLAIGWAVVTVLAVAVGLVAVSTVGAQVRDRGPLGHEVIRSSQLEGTASPRPEDPSVRRDVSGEWGVFVVSCRGVVAYGEDARPDTAGGWEVVSFEPGPDDDVDAVFRNGQRSIDLEVFCNRGEPTVAEQEVHTLPED